MKDAAQRPPDPLRSGLSVVGGVTAPERMRVNMANNYYFDFDRVRETKRKRYYLASGSNLNAQQMRVRCPFAVVLGTAVLDGWELLFKGSKTGSYLTIEECAGGKVPVAVWEVTESDEAALDRYEGFPTFYYKHEIKVRYKGIRTGKRRTVTAFVYIMHEDRPIGIPSDFYMHTCLKGYNTFSFDENILLDAYDKCVEAVEDEE